MIRGFPVVRVRPAFQQEARHLRVMRHAGDAVEHAFPFGRGLVIRLEEACIRARPGVEQRGRRAHKSFRPRTVEPQILREAQVGQGVPSARTSLRRGRVRVERQEAAHHSVVAEQRGGVDVATRDFRVGREDRLGALQGAVPDTRLDESIARVA